VAVDEVWEPGYESKEKSGSSDRSVERLTGRIARCSNHRQPWSER